MSARPELSELEGATIGLVLRHGPCTAYFVRKSFSASRSHNWKASAGAIYPLIAKLVSIGLIAEQTVAGDKRKTRKLTVTPEGRKAWHAWMIDGSPGLASAVADPIRTRLQFLDELPNKRIHLVDAWIAATQVELDRLAKKGAALPAESADNEALAVEGALAQLEARLGWLKLLLERWR